VIKRMYFSLGVRIDMLPFSAPVVEGKSHAVLAINSWDDSPFKPLWGPAPCQHSCRLVRRRQLC